MDKRELNTLIIEDDPFSVAVIQQYSKELDSYCLNINHTVSLEESLNFLDNHPEIDIIFLDYRVHSKITGLEILQHIRAKGIDKPVIVITGSGNEETAVAMMKAGATDYLVKARLTPSRLEKAIEYSLNYYKARLDKTKASLKEQLYFNELLIKDSLSGICLLDEGYKVIYVNEAFLNLWNYDKEEQVIGKHIKTFFYEGNNIDDILECLKEKKSWLGELKGIKNNSDVFYVQGLFSLISLKERLSPQIMISFIDITKIKDDEKKRERLYQGITEVFALRAEESGNVETASHIHRIAAYTRFIARKLKERDEFKNYIDEQYISDLGYASMLHDIGKWRTPNEILLKETGLNDEEWEFIKKHPLLGKEMLTPLLKDKEGNLYLKLVESVVLYHHERWDGSGYPYGLKGEQIPLSARIVALADVYDALTSDRSYRKALPHQEACKIIEREKDKFDPRIWEIFIKYNEEFRRIREETK